MRGIQCFIIAPIKGHEFRRACNRIGGSFIRIALGSQHCINVMEIRPTLSPEMKLIDEAPRHTGEAFSYALCVRVKCAQICRRGRACKRRRSFAGVLKGQNEDIIFFQKIQNIRGMCAGARFFAETFAFFLLSGRNMV